MPTPLLDKIIIGKSVPFERVRRITGYLSNVSRFNDAKRCELRDRVTHSLSSRAQQGCGCCAA